jgi:phosphatidylglycerol:prolipoprotein diacylglycerol transferase
VRAALPPVRRGDNERKADASIRAGLRIAVVDPIAAVLAGYPISTFAVFVDLGAATWVAMTVWLGRQRGLAAPALLDAIPWVLGASLAGARLFYVAEHWAEFAPHPVAIISIWEGGLSLPGAVTAGALAAALAFARSGLPVAAALDSAAPGLALGQAIGRLGCVPAGCAAGVPLDSGSWLPRLALPDSTGLVVERFPSQVVEAGVECLLAILLLVLWHRRLRPGAVAATYLAAYGLLRLAADPFRLSGSGAPPGSLVQWWALASVATGLAALVWLQRTGRRGHRLRRPCGEHPAPAAVALQRTERSRSGLRRHAATGPSHRP